MRITDITATSFTQPMVPIHRKRFKGEQEIVLVTVVTDEGLEGYAMARTYGGTTGRVISESIVTTLKPRVVGRDPLNRERVWQEMWQLEHGVHAPIFAISAVDVALWDLAGKILHTPVYQLIGGYRDSIPAYASSSFLDDTDAYLRDVDAALQHGFRAYKIHPFQNPARDMELCRTVRRAVGSEVDLMLDVVSTYDRVSALRVGRALEELNFLWYEEPLPHYDIQGYVELSRALDIPIAGAETIAGSVYSAALFIRANALDMIMCDVYWKGGITGMLKTACLCEAMGLKITSHHGASPVMNFANLHVLCGISNADFIEMLIPEEEYNYGLQSYLKLDTDGLIQVPQAPGLGIEIDWDYVRAHTTGEM